MAVSFANVETLLKVRKYARLVHIQDTDGLTSYFLWLTYFTLCRWSQSRSLSFNSTALSSLVEVSLS